MRPGRSRRLCCTHATRHTQAAKEDFCVFAGYAGWAPAQLQGEVERDSWFLAAADSSVLLQELLQQAREVPASRAGDGQRTWDTLMEGIGKAEQAGQSCGCLSDRTLGRWVDTHLYPHSAAAAAAAAEAEAEADDAGVAAAGARSDGGDGSGRLVGRLLRTRVASEESTVAGATSSAARTPEYALSEQYLHKALTTSAVMWLHYGI